MKQIRLKDGKVALITCCESRIHHPEDSQCPCKNIDAHGDGEDGCNLGGSSIRDGEIPKDCPLEDAEP